MHGILEKCKYSKRCGQLHPKRYWGFVSTIAISLPRMLDPMNGRSCEGERLWERLYG